jgi:hypothetical protein
MGAYQPHGSEHVALPGNGSYPPALHFHSLKRGWNGMDWIYLAQDMDQRRALVNTAMNLRVP